MKPKTAEKSDSTRYPWRALDVLAALLEANVFGDGVFPELMRTPKMKQLLSNHHTKITKLREAAGWKARTKRRGRETYR